jgi:hypothetical protein
MIALAPLAGCEARELVEVKSDRGAEWAIVGKKDPGYHPLIFLTGENAPFVLNTEPDMGYFKDYPVAKYGTNYRFVHNPNGPSQIGADELSKTAGSLVFTQAGDWFLVVSKFRQPGVRWCHLASGAVLGAAGLASDCVQKLDAAVRGISANAD